jgi:hypothetical protein
VRTLHCIPEKTANQLKSADGKKPVYQAFVQNTANFFFGPGDVKFKDVNGDGELNNGKGTLADHGDLEMIGNSLPRYEYGFRIGADFKGFDFGIFFQGVGNARYGEMGSLLLPATILQMVPCLKLLLVIIGLQPLQCFLSSCV